jgi:S-DNA-T family DNA segregation ATPase FtsK/SpoIIIE
MPKAKKKTARVTAAEKSRAEEERQRRQAQDQQTAAIVLLALGVLAGCMMFIPGTNLWKGAHEAMLGIFGVCTFLCPAFLIYIAFLCAFSGRKVGVSAKLGEAAAFTVLICSLVEIFTLNSDKFPGFGAIFASGVALRSGGVFGSPGYALVKLFGKTGAAIIDILLTAVFFMLVMGITIAQIRDRVKKTRAQVADAVMEKREEAEEQASEYNAMRNEPRYNIDVDLGPAPKQKPEPKKEISEIFSKKTKPAQVSTSGLDELVSSIAKLNVPEGEKAPEAPSQAHTDAAKIPEPNAAAQKTAPSASEQPAAPAEAEKQAKTYTITPVTAAQAAAAMQGAPAPKQGEDAQQRIYSYPPLTLLSPADRPDNIDVAGELRSNAARLVDTLKSFGVETRITDISRGPAVTRYELQPSAGVKISRITSLADDIALNLAASGVRIEAPIPNKAAVGIEVPNKKVSTVHIREILESQEFRTAPSKLTVALGRDIAGKPSVTNIYNMPHVLIAGATGSGKSVCINSIIISLLYKASPKEVKLLMIDPKIVELGCYNGIPHLLVPVVTEPKRAAGALNWAVGEMQKRYQTFAECSVRDIRGYNTLAARSESLEPMPQVVVIIDELADLIMAVPGEVEDSICRLAQKARAAGMHLVIATQRPSVDVITGVIKANIPSRIAFAVSSQVDSRTILDTGGAEKLLGRGRYALLAHGRLQAHEDTGLLCLR